MLLFVVQCIRLILLVFIKIAVPDIWLRIESPLVFARLFAWAI